MTRISASYYDGRSSIRRAVELVFTDQGQVEIRGEDLNRSFDYPELRISSRLGNTPRYIYLPDGARLEVADNDAIDFVIGQLGGYEGNSFLHLLESRYTTALAALVICLGVVFSVIEYGIPLLAKQVAFALPPGVESTLGQEGLQTLDRAIFRPSTLSPSTQSKLQGLFQMLLNGGAERPDTRLEFRSSPQLGANAFALPSGIVVITDDLVRLAQDDEELIAVIHCRQLVHFALGVDPKLLGRLDQTFFGFCLAEVVVAEGVQAVAEAVLVKQAGRHHGADDAAVDVKALAA